jgi:hypothetical protein
MPLLPALLLIIAGALGNAAQLVLNNGNPCPAASPAPAAMALPASGASVQSAQAQQPHPVCSR